MIFAKKVPVFSPGRRVGSSELLLESVSDLYGLVAGIFNVVEHFGAVQADLELAGVHIFILVLGGRLVLLNLYFYCVRRQIEQIFVGAARRIL